MSKPIELGRKNQTSVRVSFPFFQRKVLHEKKKQKKNPNCLTFFSFFQVSFSAFLVCQSLFQLLVCSKLCTWCSFVLYFAFGFVWSLQLDFYFRFLRLVSFPLLWLSSSVLAFSLVFECFFRVCFLFWLVPELASSSLVFLLMLGCPTPISFSPSTFEFLISDCQCLLFWLL